MLPLYWQLVLRRLRKTPAKYEVSMPSLADIQSWPTATERCCARRTYRPIRQVEIVVAKRAYPLSIGILVTEYSLNVSVERR